MKITDQIMTHLAEAAKPATPKAATRSEIPTSKTRDKVDLRLPAGQVDAIKKAFSAAPAVRKDKVEQLKAEIASGNYEVGGSEVAAKLIETWGNSNG